MSNMFAKTLLGLVIIFGPSVTFGKTSISGKIVGGFDQAISVFYPINGFANENVIQRNSYVKINANNEFNIDLDIIGYAFVTLRIGQEPIWLGLQQNDSIYLLIHLDSLKNNSHNGWLEINGSNSEGHIFFNNLNFNPFNKFRAVEDVFENIASYHNNLLEVLNDSINKELYFFDSLLNIGAISKIYYHLAVKSLRANLFDGALTHLLRKSSVYSEYTEKEVDSLKNGIFLLCNPLDTMLYRGWRTNYYLHDYYASKTLDNQKRRLTDVIKDTIIYVKDKRILVAGSFVPYLAITDRILQENLWGMGLLALTNLFKDQFKGNDLEAFEDFHPASAWSPIINAVIEDNARQVSTGRHEEIKYLDSSQRITKLDSLIGLFRGKSIFIDIWATWCYPCRQEFAFNGYIDSILNQNGIVRICISIDNPMLIETWKKTIARFNLQGYQVLAAKPLVDEIRRNLYNAGEDFLIPRYILIDRNGRVAEKDAFRPSSGKMLKAQIMAFLSNNGQTQEKSKN